MLAGIIQFHFSHKSNIRSEQKPGLLQRVCNSTRLGKEGTALVKRLCKSFQRKKNTNAGISYDHHKYSSTKG